MRKIFNFNFNAAWLWAKPTLELSKSLIMLRDSNISGRLAMKDMPALLNMLLFWKVRLSCFLASIEGFHL